MEETKVCTCGCQDGEPCTCTDCTCDNCDCPEE